ncbi:hypothetical protein [Longitalea luteola]|uniref:hypothetical protein n=1 Tax=Longitalea luteola TaxID=2812563 RepID=UPI001A959C9A|nr:hypothetical protein [Longitalea luteola]
MTSRTLPGQPSYGAKPLLKTILWVGLLAGSLDILAACLQAYLVRGTSPAIVLQFIASAAFGKPAFFGGWQMALAGLLFHFIIAYSFTALYFLIYPFIWGLVKHIAIAAIVYGIFIFVVMNLVVLPMTKLPPIPFKWDKAAMAAGILILAIGLPVTFFARRYYRQGETAPPV